MYETELWSRNEAWKEKDKVYIRISKTVMGVIKCAANGFAKMELGSQ
jgi:hypothetical protein